MSSHFIQLLDYYHGSKTLVWNLLYDPTSKLDFKMASTESTNQYDAAGCQVHTRYYTDIDSVFFLFKINVTFCRIFFLEFSIKKKFSPYFININNF